jgi:hypothetical protein
MYQDESKQMKLTIIRYIDKYCIAASIIFRLYRNNKNESNEKLSTIP